MSIEENIYEEQKNTMKNEQHTHPVKNGMLNYIFQDAVGVYRNSSHWACLLRCFYLVPFRITVKFRFIQYLNKRRLGRVLAKWFNYRYQVKTAKMGCNLEPDTEIAPGLTFPHGFPLVIHSHVKLGRHCIVHPNVQIGTSRTKKGAPVIGDYCFLGNGCHIIGNCKIGDWCFISPGAFICKDIPEGSVVGFGINNILSDKGKETVAKYI